MDQRETPERTALIMVNFSSHELIEANFGGGRTGPTITVVVVDNFTSSEESRAIGLVCDREGWTLIRNPSNLGFGAAMNIGVRRAHVVGCTAVVLINPDASISPKCLGGLIERVSADPSAVISPRIVLPDGRPWFVGGEVLVEEGRTTTRAGSDSAGPFGWVSGACLIVTIELFTAFEGFDEDYFLYWEDVDLSWRAVAAGGHLIVADDLTVVHSVGGTQAGAGKSPLYVYYNCRNRLIFARKHLTESETRRWRASSVAYARAVMLRGGRRAFLRNPVRLTLAGISGTLAGLRG